MNRDSSDGITHSLEALSVFRGIYKRVAEQLDVDPSYVSRVARGERHAPVVTEALRKELQRVLGQAGLHNGAGQNHNHNNSHGTTGALRNGHSRNGNAPSLNDRHTPIRRKKTKTRTAKAAPQHKS